MIQLYKMAVAFATKEGRNDNGHFANRWKMRISLAARRAMTKLIMRYVNICAKTILIMMSYLMMIKRFK